MQDADLKATHDLFAEVAQESYPDKDISAEQWLRSKGANEQMLAIADACYANDFGCSLQQLGLREMITENSKWDSGTGLFHSMCFLFDYNLVSMGMTDCLFGWAAAVLQYPSACVHWSSCVSCLYLPSLALPQRPTDALQKKTLL